MVSQLFTASSQNSTSTLAVQQQLGPLNSVQSKKFLGPYIQGCSRDRLVRDQDRDRKIFPRPRPRPRPVSISILASRPRPAKFETKTETEK